MTNIIPSYNDDEHQLRGIATWILQNLGPDTPWHVTRFVPFLGLSHLPATPVRTLERGLEIGREVGLRYVYVGNVPGHRAENTYCPGCGGVLIERPGFCVARTRLVAGACPDCQTTIPIVGSVLAASEGLARGIRLRR